MCIRKIQSKIFLLFLFWVLLYPNWVQADVDTLRPNATPTENWPDETGCTDHEDCVSDDSDTSYIWDEGVGVALDCFHCPDFTSDYSVIDSVVIQIRALEYNIFGTQKVAYGRGGKDVEGYHTTCPDNPSVSNCACKNCPQAMDTTAQLTESWVNYRFAMFNCDPCDSSAWESADLNDANRNWSVLTAGTSQKVRLSEVWIFVYYQPPVAGNPRKNILSGGILK